MDRRAWYYGLALALALHNLEEAVMASRMVGMMQSRAPVFLRALYSGINVGELRINLLVLTAVGLSLAVLAARAPLTTGWSYVMLVFGAVIGLNALAHIGLSIWFRSYLPGLGTGTLITLPLVVALVRKAWYERWVSRLAFWSTAGAAILIHGPLLVFLIRSVGGASR